MTEDFGGRDERARDGGEWGVVRIVGTEEEATLIVGFLEGCGIPAELESLVFHQEPDTVGHLGEARVRVPAERLDEARRLLDERDAAPPGGDEDDDA
jgi:hypothetical protein